MPIVEALRKNAASLADAQLTYKENVVAVNTVVTSVMTSSLPTLHTDPPDWADFVSAYEQADSIALQWVNTVMARLLQVPDDVQNYNATITGLLEDAKTQATTLVSNPSNAAALAALDQDLAGLTGQLNLVVTFISGAISALQGFEDQLPTMAAQLQTIATKSVQDAHADQQQIDDLNAAIDQLRSDITSLTAAIIGLGIADGVALTLGVVATIAAWPFGALTWLVLGPVVAVATTFIALDAEKIEADKAAISAKQQQITGITADVATLNVLSQSYTEMAAQSEQIQANLQAILVAWQALEADVSAAVTDVRTAIADTGGANYSAALTDVVGAINEWTASYAAAGALQITLQVNNASLSLGMSSSQVQSALGSGEVMDIISYYNGVQSSRQLAGIS